MIRLQEPELQPSDDRSAWQASWNDDERLLAHTPPGYWQTLVNMSQVKRLCWVRWIRICDYAFSKHWTKWSMHNHG
jgi:hypothetical protein